MRTNRDLRDTRLNDSGASVGRVSI